MLFAGIIFGIAFGSYHEGDDEDAVTAVEFDEHGVVCFVDTSSTGSGGKLVCMALNGTSREGGAEREVSGS